MSEEKFFNLDESTIEEFMDIYNKKSFVSKVNFQFIGSKKQKNLIKISKLSDVNSFILEGREILVSINEELMDVFDEESRTILIEQELDRIKIDLKSGKVSVNSPELNTSAGLLSKYGIEKVARANQIETLYIEQKSDSNQESDFLV